MSTTPKITAQHTYHFKETNESVTLFISDTTKKFAWGLGYHPKDPSTAIWSSHYEGILQIPSSKHNGVWYMVLMAYWGNGVDALPIEQVLMVKDSTH